MFQFIPVNMDFWTDYNKSSAEPQFGVQVNDKYLVYVYLEWGYTHKDYPTSTPQDMSYVVLYNHFWFQEQEEKGK